VDGRQPHPKWILAGVHEGEDSYRCPRQLVTQASREWLVLYQHYGKGHLAFSGGALEQPAIYLEAMGLIAANAGSIHG
jgi:hypothetical protein